MPAKIETVIRNGELIATTQQIIQQRLGEFADAHRRLKELHVSVDVGNPTAPVVEIKATIGTEKFVGKGSANNIVRAVEDAIGRIEGKLSERRQDRKKKHSSKQESEERAGSVLKMGGVVTAVLLAVLVGFTILRMDGCTNVPANYPKTARVTGTVTLDGQPLEWANVVFAPSAGRLSSGKTDSSGRYELRFTRSIKGAMLGTHRVMITKMIPADRDDVRTAAELQEIAAMASPPPLVNLLPERYRGESSQLSTEVQDTENVIDFALVSE